MIIAEKMKTCLIREQFTINTFQIIFLTLLQKPIPKRRLLHSTKNKTIHFLKKKKPQEKYNRKRIRVNKRIILKTSYFYYKKHTDKNFEQTKTRPQETLKFKLNATSMSHARSVKKHMQTFSLTYQKTSLKE